MVLLVTIVGNDCFAEESDIFTIFGAPVQDEFRAFTVNGVSFEMVFVEGGSFTRGCDSNTRGCISDEIPKHVVSLPDFYIGRLEVTQLLWRTIMGSNPSELKGDHLPVTMVSWDDCQRFIRRLNRLTGYQFSLPTEVQWEFAARGGNLSKGFNFSGSNEIDDVAWWEDNSGDRVRRGATKLANELGIYDMTGNVFEWCADWYSPNYYRFSAENPESPTGPALGTFRVFRGGSYRNTTSFCLVTRRNYNTPDRRWNDLGFRLALNLD